MENICSVCFSAAELYQISGFTLPMCLKCSEQFTTKGITINSLNFYQTLQQQPVTATITSQQINSVTVPITVQLSASTTNQPTNLSRATDMNTDSQSSTSSHDAPINIKQEAIGLADELEKSLQNGDSELQGEEGTCGLCAKTFSRKSSLLSHMRNHSIDRKFICSYCQKGFTQAANLRNHERIHRNERPYVCNECGKAFTQVTNLNNHTRLHTGERPFVCIEANCGRSFAQVTNLNNHMKTHHKIQQYVCNQCPKKFTQQSHLSQHMKTHGVYPFKCNHCDEKFFQVSHLTQHMKTHDEFKFKCNVCFSAFNQESMLRKHMQKHTDDRHLLCPIPSCSEMFADKDLLTKHLETDHAKIDAVQQQVPVKRVYAGKYNCYFEGCNEYFDDAEKLNEHLISTHALLHKDLEARSKMNLMFLEQIKNQMTEQYVASLGAAVHQPHNSIIMGNKPRPLNNDGPAVMEKKPKIHDGQVRLS
ncbi:zinc finger protein 568-like isoform X9 [Bradysia coprophila]|uniref:zinc finger protein 568-like isoform X9 n=1 Tax=Bradysia coprophila TaxID=38358 RepID=UPI00187D9B58|nr:zinc finger protein 568-like isoform X9 [Bradysia coprophila]